MRTFYRVKTGFPRAIASYDRCATLIVGGGIALGLVTVLTMGRGYQPSGSYGAGSICLFVSFLLIINFLAKKWNGFRYIIIAICSAVSVPSFYKAIPILLSEDIKQSKLSVLFFTLAVYTLWVALLQVREIAKQRKK
ncbi:hypothetical protein [Thalassotalea agarivorans]|uniref:Uncharacterized protein n=1 Tax=Thalassotalea agarivorans TaxID=349064 RepID=A0A1H9ZWG3_THASX|nr:hypothetical protein [Thalassotalea agarivorans]SES86111.1 hypothetical protein SAMN05660429_00613 [Thalassotalea agarivorans]